VVAAMRPNVTADIEVLEIVRETSYPSLQNETLRSVSLQAIDPPGSRL
jgi:hypothetical protein